MTEMNEMVLTHESEILNSAMQNFDLMLERTIGNMTMRNADDSVLTFKLAIHFERKSVPDIGGTREIVQPSFKHDISSVVQVKDKISGTYKGNVELTFDEFGHPVVKDVDDGQVSIFDDEGKVVVDYDTAVDADIASLAGDSYRGLPQHDGEDDSYNYDDPESDNE